MNKFYSQYYNPNRNRNSYDSQDSKPFRLSKTKLSVEYILDIY